jgi:hypothetical protein
MKILLLYIILPVTKSFHRVITFSIKNRKNVLTHNQNNVFNQNLLHRREIAEHSRLFSMLDIIVSGYIICNLLKNKIILEVLNDSFMLQTFDNFKPMDVFIIMIGSTLSFNNSKYNTKIAKLQINKPRKIYRWIDFSVIVIMIILMKNVKNAI